MLQSSAVIITCPKVEEIRGEDVCRYLADRSVTKPISFCWVDFKHPATLDYSYQSTDVTFCLTACSRMLGERKEDPPITIHHADCIEPFEAIFWHTFSTRLLLIRRCVKVDIPIKHFTGFLGFRALPFVTHNLGIPLKDVHLRGTNCSLAPEQVPSSLGMMMEHQGKYFHRHLSNSHNAFPG